MTVRWLVLSNELSFLKIVVIFLPSLNGHTPVLLCNLSSINYLSFRILGGIALLTDVLVFRYRIAPFL